MVGNHAELNVNKRLYNHIQHAAATGFRKQELQASDMAREEVDQYDHKKSQQKKISEEGKFTTTASTLL